MELPVVIVDAYADPQFAYFREYNEITKLLGKEWPALKEKLQTDPEPILPALLAYQVALSIQLKFNQEMVILLASPSWYEHENWPGINRYYNMGIHIKGDAEDRFWELTCLLYSKGSFYNHTHFIHPMV
jgi:hypothetical protein